MGTPVPILSCPRWRFAYFAAMGKVGRRPQAAKSPVFSLPPRLVFPQNLCYHDRMLGEARRKEVLV